MIEKIKKICKDFGYDLEVMPTILDCVIVILMEVQKEVEKELEEEN